MARLVWVLVVTLLCGPALAGKGSQESVHYDRPTIVSLVGVGTYNPYSSKAGSSPQATIGLRCLLPELKDRLLENSCVQLTANVISTDFEDLYGLQLSVLQFLQRSSTFGFDHHFFYGAGVGSTMVERRQQQDLLVPAFLFEAGLQSRIRDWHLETSLQLVIGPERGAYDISGMVTKVVVAYHFDR